MTISDTLDTAVIKTIKGSTSPLRKAKLIDENMTGMLK
jgi:hypothetical protein